MNPKLIVIYHFSNKLLLFFIIFEQLYSDHKAMIPISPLTLLAVWAIAPESI